MGRSLALKRGTGLFGSVPIMGNEGTSPLHRGALERQYRSIRRYVQVSNGRTRTRHDTTSVSDMATSSESANKRTREGASEEAAPTDFLWGGERRPTIAGRRVRKRATLPAVGDLVTCRVNKISPRLANVRLLVSIRRPMGRPMPAPSSLPA